MACFAVCAAIRPKFFGVTSTSTMSPTFASGLIRRAAGSEISSCGLVTRSATIKLARARISPVLGLISMRSSREALTLFLEAESNAFETASSKISRFIPRSRSR